MDKPEAYPTGKMKVCALIPAYNEAPHIAAVARGAARHVAEVVVIDDGSTDGTYEAAASAGVTCLRMPRNQGKAVALRAGLEYAQARDFTHVLTLDGDGQHLPEDIPALLDAGAADLVIGARGFDRAGMPRSRYFSNTVGSKVASWLVGREILDSQSGFRLIRLERLRGVRLRSRCYEFEMELLIKVVRGGGTVGHAPVRAVYHDGQARSKMHPVRDTVRICLWSLAFRYLRV
jgi:glycosyltransferase involved in cell wall biosynthesis